MPTYTVKAGDSLSKIAKAHGVSDWRAIYNDPANAGFRVKRPNPNLIQPGDSIVIPGGAAGAATGAATGGGAAATPASSGTPGPLMGPPSPTTEWIVVATDGTCSEEAYNTTYRRDAQNVSQVSSSDAYKGLTGTTFSNRSYCKKFHDDAYVLNQAFIPGGGTAGFWVMNKVKEGTSYLTVQINKNPAARIALVGHSRGGMVAVLIAKWLQEQSVEVDFLGLYDAVDRAPNTSAAVVQRGNWWRGIRRSFCSDGSGLWNRVERRNGRLGDSL